MDVARQAPVSMGIPQARILEWVAMPSSRGSSQPRDRTQDSQKEGRFFTVWATRGAQRKPWDLLIYWCWLPLCRLFLVAESGDCCLLQFRRLSCCQARVLGTQAPVCAAQTQDLWYMGLAAPRHVESSRIRDRTSVFCIGRLILIYCTNRKVSKESPKILFKACPSLQMCSAPYSIIPQIFTNHQSCTGLRDA